MKCLFTALVIMAGAVFIQKNRCNPLSLVMKNHGLFCFRKGVKHEEQSTAPACLMPGNKQKNEY